MQATLFQAGNWRAYSSNLVTNSVNTSCPDFVLLYLLRIVFLTIAMKTFFLLKNIEIVSSFPLDWIEIISIRSAVTWKEEK